MTKQEFLSALFRALSCLPQDDRLERLNFYSDMIDDRMEDGLSEEDAVAELGTVNDIVAQILEETPLTVLVKEKFKPKRKLQGWEIALLIVGAPLWVPLLIAAGAVILSLYVSLWAIVISLWAVFASAAATAVGGIVGGTVLAASGYALSGVVLIAAALVCAGLSILLFFGCKAATVGTARLAAWTISRFKSRCVGKEDAV